MKSSIKNYFGDKIVISEINGKPGVITCCKSTAICGGLAPNFHYMDWAPRQSVDIPTTNCNRFETFVFESGMESDDQS